ncbi:hypothetical protein [Ralstonia pseudosolanacearum]|uniref:hypothetical protein n=1 Tax=Ralstonia pseudosolanacearum TaxID=1310165 RepID=UPI000AC76B68|nr:hypothetical protein [Ralstonia pseudosolanacearum]MCL1621797.1 hypothetical protein [Ralstonia pseudosolanacearum CaRs-Mep]MCQ4678437.1 hypothetical protein [Ralstonia pseudosolanacearum]
MTEISKPRADMQQAAGPTRADDHDSGTAPTRSFAAAFPSPIVNGIWWVWCHLVWAWQCIEHGLAERLGGAPATVMEGVIRAVRAGDAAFDVYQAMGLQVAPLARLNMWHDANDPSSEMYYRVTPVVLELDDGRIIHFCEYQVTNHPLPGNAPDFADLAAGERVCAVGWWERDMFSAWGLRLREGHRSQIIYAVRPPRDLPRRFDELLARRPHGFAKARGDAQWVRRCNDPADGLRAACERTRCAEHRPRHGGPGVLAHAAAAGLLPHQRRGNAHAGRTTAAHSRNDGTRPLRRGKPPLPKLRLCPLRKGSAARDGSTDAAHRQSSH